MTISDFISKWFEAKDRGLNISQLARELKLTRQAVSIKAIRLRAKGIELPLLDRTRSK